MDDKAMETLIYEVRDGVALVTLNRPDRMNTLGGAMKDELRHVFSNLARFDPQVHAVVMTGAGERAFCAGADIKERATSTTTLPDFHLQQKATHDLFRDIETLEKPVIAAINGVALGGGLELALCADIRIASTDARLGLPEARIGALPAAGGTQRLPRVVGQGWAKQLMFTGDHIDAQHALRIGLVNEVLAPTELLPRAFEMARRIAGCAPLSVRFIKQAIDLGMQTSLEAGLEYERFAAAIVVTSEDRTEGMRAFVEKRPPVFKGRCARPFIFQESQPMDLNLRGRSAYITGAGQGVGRRIALQLAEEGCRVAVNDYFAERAEAVVREIQANGGEAFAAPADITDKAQVDATLDAAAAAFGGLDILVNNAGVTVDRRAKGGMAPLFVDTEPVDWRQIIELNILGMLHCCHRVLPGMRERRWGRIVNIMSEAGRAGEARLAVYSGAKAAMLGFAKAIAQEHGRDGITVNTVALGAVSHEGIKAGPLAPDATPQTDERLAKMLNAYPVARGLQRLCRPDDIAPMVCLLASDRAAWVTGQSVGVSGGFHMA